MQRIAIFQPCVPHYRIALFDGLAATPGLDVTVYSDESRVRNGLLPQASKLRLARNLDARMRSLGPFFWQSRTLSALVSQPRYDIVVFSWNSRNLALLPALLLARMQGIPTILWGHGYSKKDDPISRWMRNLIGAAADALLFYDEETLASHRINNRFFKKGYVARNALDITPIVAARRHYQEDPQSLLAFRNNHGLPGRKNVLFVSRLDLANHVDWLLDAFRIVAERIPDSRLIIVGGGTERESLERLGKALGISSHVFFTGPIYDEVQLAGWALNCQVFVYPANVGLSLLHAFAYGLPVITTDRHTVQNPEIVYLKNGVNGQTYPHGNCKALAERIIAILKDQDVYERMAHNAAVTVYSEGGANMETMLADFSHSLREVSR